jgi:hypothetical protein
VDHEESFIVWLDFSRSEISFMFILQITTFLHAYIFNECNVCVFLYPEKCQIKLNSRKWYHFCLLSGNTLFYSHSSWRGRESRTLNEELSGGAHWG